MDTRYASSDRSSDELINDLFIQLNQVPVIQELLDRSTDIMFILDQNRQIIFTNRAFLKFLGSDNVKDVLGKRPPGEALGCIHSGDVSGCGTTEFCLQCGAVNAILTSQETDKEAEEECRISINSGLSYELMVIAKPFHYLGTKLSFFTAKDISDSKRKAALEKIFFHDIMNLASGIYSVTDLFKEEPPLSEMPEKNARTSASVQYRYG